MIKILPDLISLIGVGGFGYGLWLYEPWIGFAASGAVLVVIGILAGRGQ